MGVWTRIRADTKNAMVAAIMAQVSKRPQRLVDSLAREAYDRWSFDAVRDRQDDPEFDGDTYDPAFDHARLKKQIGRIYDVMESGSWLTLKEISDMTGDPEASISAQLRHLRKPRFGGYLVKKRSRGVREAGLYEYRLLGPDGRPLNGSES